MLRIQSRARRLCAAIALTGVLAAFAPQGVVFASPTNLMPSAALDVRDEPTSAELALEATALDGAVSAEVVDIEKKLAEGNYKQADGREMLRIGNTFAKIDQLKRAAAQLEILAEPAGVDFRLRAASLSQRLDTIVSEYKKLPKFPQVVQPSLSQLQNLSKKRAAQLPKIGQQFKQGRVDLAEKELNEIADSLVVIAVWHDRNAQADAFRPFTAALQAVNAKMFEDRTAAAATLLEELRKAKTPDFAGSLAKMKSAVTAVGQNGQADWDGKMLDGPALIAAWETQWHALHLAAMNTLMIDFARKTPRNTAPPSELDQLVSSSDGFQKEMLTVIGELISADAKRVSAADVPALHARYVDSLAKLAPRISDASSTDTFENALDELANKSPEFAAQVAAYRLATDEVLRWRKRVAEAQAKQHTAEAKSLSEVLRTAVEQNGDKPGLLSPRAPLDQAQLYSPLPEVVITSSPLIVDQLVLVNDIAPTMSRNAAQSAYSTRHYVTLPKISIPERRLAAFRADLYVEPGLPPLTLPAAMALHTAEAGFLKSAGIETAAVGFDSLLVHFMRLDPTSSCLPLGPLPPQTFTTPSINQMMLRVDAEPKWLYNEHLFVKLP